MRNVWMIDSGYSLSGVPWFIDEKLSLERKNLRDSYTKKIEALDKELGL